MVAADISRIAVSVDLLPGEVLAIQSESGSGTVAITFDGFTSNFGPTEGEVEKSSGGKVINLTGDAESVTPVVLITEPEESGDE
jgi:ABC-type phosphonate transport system ATPase subunit